MDFKSLIAQGIPTELPESVRESESVRVPTNENSFVRGDTNIFGNEDSKDKLWNDETI